MSLVRPSMQIAGVIAVVTLCSACSGGGGGVDVPGGSGDLEPCTVVTLVVDDLAADEAPGCNLEGSFLTFPGPVRLGIPAVGDVVVHERTGDVSYHVVNWGVPVVGAATVDADHRVVDIWGSSTEAVELQKEQLRISAVTVPD